MDVLIIKGIANVHEHMFTSVWVLDEGFEATVLLCRGFPASWVVVVGLITHGSQRLGTLW